MSWDLNIGRVDDAITFYDGTSLRAAVAGALLADGTFSETALRVAREAWGVMNDGQRMVWSMTLSNGQQLKVWDSSPEPQYGTRRDGLDGDGNRCGRYLNHPGGC
jgi:hypothetical protein